MIGLKRKWLRHTLKILQHLFGTEKLKWFLLTAESTFQENFSQQNFYTYARAKTAMSPRHRLHSIYCKIALILRTFIIIFSLEILSPDLKRNSWIRNTKFSEDWPFNFWSSNVTYTAVYLVADVKYTAVYLVGDVKYTAVYLVGDVKMRIVNLSYSGVTAWKVSKYEVFFGPYISVFGLNTEIYAVNLRIQSEYRKIRTRNNSVFGHFSRCAYLLER